MQNHVVIQHEESRLSAAHFVTFRTAASRSRTDPLAAENGVRSAVHNSYSAPIRSHLHGETAELLWFINGHDFEFQELIASLNRTSLV